MGISRTRRVVLLALASASAVTALVTMNSLALAVFGGSWSIVPSPNTSINQDNVLKGVTCVTANNCWAVGYVLISGSSSSTIQTLIEHFDGTSWSIATSPNTGTSGDYLSDVTCISATDCWAVGGLLEHYDGTGWSIVPSASQAGSWSAITCITSNDCWVVGVGGGVSNAATLTEHWNGSGWSVVASPNSVADNFLTSVACPASNDCWALGQYGDNCQCGGPSFLTLAEHYDGTQWSIASTPNGDTTSNNFISGVRCTSASNCWAVGDYGGASRTLVEHYDGSHWMIAPSPDAGTTVDDHLRGVTCITSTDCWSVGFYANVPKMIDGTLTLHYDGASWSLIPSPNPSTAQFNHLLSVACINSSNCWSVGSSGGPGRDQTLAEQFVVPPPSAPVLTADSPPTPALAGKAFSYTFMATGSPPPTFAVTSGSLPTGLRLDGTSGVLSGTPTAVGSFTFKVQAANGVIPNALSPSITLRIQPANAPFVYTVTNTADSGPGSLTVGILEANAQSNLATIRFAVPGTGTHVISPAGGFPQISARIMIDGTTQPGYAGTPLIELNGGNVTTSCGIGCTVAATALAILGPSSSVRGLQITGWSGDAIALYPGSSSDVVAGNVITDNKGGGINSSSNSNRFGGTSARDRNVIAGNSIGISVGGNGNRVEGNYIGTDATGTATNGNATGIAIGGRNNLVGGDDPHARNIISGNGSIGLTLSDAIDIESPSATGNRVEGNYIGTDVSGTVALGNVYRGILISSGATRNIIGGDALAARNVIAGSVWNAVEINGTGTNSNRVEGNFIGTDVTGAIAMGNGGAGVAITGGASSTTIGGQDRWERNVISNSGYPGVDIAASSSGDHIQGNYIGTDATGASAMGNQGEGVLIEAGASRNVIGGGSPAERNVISANGAASFNSGSGVDIAGTDNRVEGNYIGTDAEGAHALGNYFGGIVIESGATSNTLGGNEPGQRNLISGNARDGIDVNDVSNRVLGNYIGTDATGMTALGNSGVGVVVCCGMTLGGDQSGDRNVISGNAGDGVDVGGNNNNILGNFIGTNALGTAAIPNGGSGVLVGIFSDANIIGGFTPGVRNLISGNASANLEVDGNSTVVAGNYIGTDASGSNSVSNLTDGVLVLGNRNTIGGYAHGARNLISGNRNGTGVAIAGTGNSVAGNYIGTDTGGTHSNGNTIGVAVSGSGNTIGGNGQARNVISGNGDGVFLGVDAFGNTVAGNYVGTDASGERALGNGGFGISVSGDQNTLGGTTPGTGNVISANGSGGINISGLGTSPTATLVEGNYIGIDATADNPLPNLGDGVHIASATNNTVGGAVLGAGNRIAHNLGAGVLVDGTQTTGNAINGNSIYDNHAGGIALINGGNGYETPPAILSVTRGVGWLSISGSATAGSHRIEVFSDPSCKDPEGRQFLGFVDIANGSWLLKVSPDIVAGRALTATATDESTRNTSQFSACFKL